MHIILYYGDAVYIQIQYVIWIRDYTDAVYIQYAYEIYADAVYIQVNFLSQVRLSHRGDGPQVAKRLVDVYFALFKVI